MPPDPPVSVSPAIDSVRLRKLLVDVVAADSTNPPGGESRVVAVLAKALSRNGLAFDKVDVVPGRPNLSAAFGSAGGPTLLLNAHTDTMPVGTGWTRPPFSGEIEHGRVYGRGACDAKGGLAAMVEAVLSVVGSGLELRGRLIFEAVIDEEATAAGTRASLAAGLRADWAVIAEPTGLAIARASNGQLVVALTVHGRAAHGSTPDAGRSAIADAAALVAAFEAAHRRLQTRDHPILGSASYSVGTIHGGVQASIVAAECRLEVDRRILPGSTPDEALGEVDAIVKEVRSARPGLDVSREVVLAIPPVEVAADSPVCSALAGSLARLGRQPSIGGLRATSDAAWLARAGIEPVVFGPGSLSQAHGPDEFVELAEVELAARALVSTIVRLLT